MVPAIGIIAIVIVIGLLASLVLLGNLSAAAVTTTVTATVASTATDTVSREQNSSSPSYSLNAEQIYASANQSIVTLQGTQVVNTVFGQGVTGVLGTGFAIQYLGSYYIVTNFHVAGTTSNLTATYSDGNAYPATVIGSDPYADLAIVTVRQAPASEFHALTLQSSSTLQVGQAIVAIGDPYGLTGSMTEGIISQLGRTLQDPTAGNFSIANVIQFSAPINPGNSGGPLIDAQEGIVGITTATVSSSQGVGFAIPSDTIIKELPSLIANGSYNLHSYLGIGETDMNYQLAQAMAANLTYGVLVEDIVSGGPANLAGLKGGNTTAVINGQQYLIGGDIITSVNGTRITSTDALGTYLEEHTVAGEVLSLGIIRSGTQPMTLNITLGSRPAI
ncbi:MAG: S1C family serine protease [Nitrososphaerales archaeon]